ncbi:transposase [Methylotuvimicrobium sp. KM1]|uniref:transposase n=1 Tax=Methylotuvimicrobium sp. KM1 TaxID=3377707 RepID=UPI003850706F
MTTPSTRNPRLPCFSKSKRNTLMPVRLTLICDNARYYRSRLVTEYLENSKNQLEFLSPYAPNLNLIERY